jgi:hypothetical protein
LNAAWPSPLRIRFLYSDPDSLFEERQKGQAMSRGSSFFLARFVLMIFPARVFSIEHAAQIILPQQAQ